MVNLGVYVLRICMVSFLIYTQWPPIYVVWWKTCGDALNTLVCTCSKEVAKKRNVFAVRVTFHPCAVLTPVNQSLPRCACGVWWATSSLVHNFGSIS